MGIRRRIGGAGNGGELLFAVPEPYRVREVCLDGRRQGVKWVASEVIGLGFTLGTGRGWNWTLRGD